MITVLSFDFAGMISQALTFASQLLPAFTPVMGILLGIGIVTFIIGVISLVFKFKKS